MGQSAVNLPASLVYPWHKAFAPRVGLALRLPKQTVVLRAGFGMNYTVGEYANFANTMAHQPPFTNEQTNLEAVGNLPSTPACRRRLASRWHNGFPAPAQRRQLRARSALRLPYVEAWNLDVQKTLPWGIVMNVGYNGSKGQPSGHRKRAARAACSPGHQSRQR